LGITWVTWEIKKTTRGQKVDLARLPSNATPRSSRQNAASLHQPSSIHSSFHPHLHQEMSYNDPIIDLEDIRPLKLPQKNV